MASHIFVKDISPESLAARDGNIQEGDVVLKVRDRVGEGDEKPGDHLILKYHKIFNIKDILYYFLFSIFFIDGDGEKN